MVASANATDTNRASPVRFVKQARRGRRSDHQGEDEQRADDGNGHGCSTGDDDQEDGLDALGAQPPGGGDLGGDRGKKQSPVEHGDRQHAHDREHKDREDLARADAQDLAKEQREDLGLVLNALAEKGRSEGEHHDQREGGDGVGASAPREPADAEGGTQREDAEANERVDADQIRAGRAGESAVRDCVGREGRATQYDKESHDSRHDGHDCARLPGVDHEAREHQALSATRAPRGPPRPATPLRSPRRRRTGIPEARYATKISATMNELTGRPWLFENQ